MSQSRPHQVYWFQLGCTFPRTLDNRPWLYSDEACRWAHLAQLFACHKKLLDSSRKHPIGTFRTHEPILITQSIFTVIYCLLSIFKSRSCDMMSYLPSGERMYLAWMSPYMSAASWFSDKKFSLANSSSVGPYLRFSRALHWARRSFGKFSWLSPVRLN